MATIHIDGRDYDLDSLSDQARAQIVSLQFVEGELQRLNARVAVCHTAKMAYLDVLKRELIGAASSEPVKLQ